MAMAAFCSASHARHTASGRDAILVLLVLLFSVHLLNTGIRLLLTTREKGLLDYQYETKPFKMLYTN
jgi:hypothetical protein